MADELRFVDNETPSGVMDGTNDTFTLANAPKPSGSLLFFRNGIEQVQGVGYTLNGKTITMSTPAPNENEGDSLRAWYRY